MQAILFSQLEPGQKFRITLNTAAHIEPDDMFYIADVDNHVVHTAVGAPLKSYSRYNITRQLREAGLVMRRE